eukprot:CAMPEP_0114378206 /NCGR_PEP_ID=MMETSP0102-20121206/1478_1 /TAXON_ID=38822 ORGANISM="Pteridomonas danica, Strain PT" /NCGR_SAMPLE_ID=MMETSP0102 /ASSEMBLY_ACC=CAM_ASM_000212 /LENGTH=307 /DNA_ID=CAMNT_0001532977 /DNA_START=334 /DNA_END=1257 /DNA_ORIENTATION=+
MERLTVNKLKKVEQAHEHLVEEEGLLKQEHEHLQDEWSNLIEQSNETTKRLVNTEAELKEKEHTLSATLSNLSDVNEKLEKTALNCSDQRKQIEELTKLKEFLTTASEKASVERSALLEQLRVATQTAEDLHASHEEKHAKLKHELTSKVSMLESHKASIHEKYETHKEKSTEERSNLREDLIAHRTQVSNLEASISASQEAIQSLTEQRDVLASDLGSLREKHALASMKTVEITGKLEASEKANMDYMNQISELKTSSNEANILAEKTLSNIEKEKEQLTNQVEEYNNEIEKNKILIQNKENEMKF